MLEFDDNLKLLKDYFIGDEEEIKKLKAQVKRLEMERDILKKATAFFAAETK